MRPRARWQYQITPEVPGTIKRAHDLQLGARKEKTQDNEGRRTGWTKKCFRSYVDFLPHCKANPIAPSATGLLFYRQCAPLFSRCPLLWHDPLAIVSETPGAWTLAATSNLEAFFAFARAAQVWPREEPLKFMHNPAVKTCLNEASMLYPCEFALAHIKRVHYLKFLLNNTHLLTHVC